MRVAIVVASAIAASTVCRLALAFETPTHAAMTHHAFEQSALSGADLQSRLGLVDYDMAVGSRYLDMGSSVIARESQTYDVAVLTQLRDVLAIPADFTISGWIMRGAIREDDNDKETPGADEPGGVFRRVYGHFFDPVNNRGLTVVTSKGAPAPDWALVTGATADGRQNHFKLSDATEAVWRAVTLKKADGAGGFSDDVWPSGFSTTMTAEQVRQAYWATAFRTLGDAVHLLQDMAQPQHTRNDSHSGYGCFTNGVLCLAGHASFFEFYLRARSLQARQFFLSEGMLEQQQGEPIFTNAGPLTYLGYDKPMFGTYREYFGVAAQSVQANRSAKGLANFSNRNFYSYGQKPP